MECFDAWTASKNFPSNLMQVAMLRIVKVKNRLSITHAVSAVKCFSGKVIWKGKLKSHKESAIDDNFVPSLAFETADQVVLDQVVEDSAANNTEIENTESSTQFDFVEVEIKPTEEVNSRNVHDQK